MDGAERDAFDSTQNHIIQVGNNMQEAICNLMQRMLKHDRSKFSPEEWPGFSTITSRLKGLAYGSPEYKAQLQDPAIKIHQLRNPHHPEYYGGDMSKMSLFDLIELLCDWRAAGERHNPPTPFEKSLEYGFNRFNVPEALRSVLTETAMELGFIDDPRDETMLCLSEVPVYTFTEFTELLVKDKVDQESFSYFYGFKTQNLGIGEPAVFRTKHLINLALAKYGIYPRANGYMSGAVIQAPAPKAESHV